MIQEKSYTLPFSLISNLHSGTNNCYDCSRHDTGVVRNQSAVIETNFFTK